MNYKFFMVPGILVLLLTMVGANLTAINIVKEKEIGTIEQINVTPIKKYHFILGKFIPFWALDCLFFQSVARSRGLFMELFLPEVFYHLFVCRHLFARSTWTGFVDINLCQQPAAVDADFIFYDDDLCFAGRFVYFH